MKFNKAKKELILDPTYKGGGKGVIKGEKDHNDECIEVGKKAKGQKKNEGTCFAIEPDDVVYLLNPDAKGQRPPGVKVKKAKGLHH